MPQKLQFLLVAPLVALGSFLFCAIATAQITPDRTLGSESSTVRQDTIKGIKSDVIEGGATRGANLFHSFQEFNISEGRGAYFANPAAIENILTRVTGGNPSNILGTLGVLGNANLFLINPNGIIFGANARLDVRGAFVASTADSILFNHGFEFSASNPQAPPLLTVNIPIGLRFREKAGDINNAGNLSVPKDLTLKAENLDLSGSLLAGGNLTLEARDTVKVRDSVTKPFIAAAGGNLQIQGDRAVDIFALNHPNSGLFSGGDLVLRSANSVGGDAHFWSGGNFRIEQLDGSFGGLFSPNASAIRANGDVALAFYEGASLHILAGGSVTIPGYVWIQRTDPVNGIVENVTLSDGMTVAIDGRTQPTLDIRAGTTALGVAFIDTGEPTSADINVGTIFFRDAVGNPLAGTILLTNQDQPNPKLPGNIQISATLTDFFPNIATGTSGLESGGLVIFDSKAGITVNGIIQASALSTVPAPAFPNYLGNGGDITLLANDDITLTPGSLMRSDGLLGGNIILKSQADISASSSSIISNSFTAVPGSKGGNINVTARSLFLDGGAVLFTGTFGRANAGNVNINASDTVIIDGFNPGFPNGLQSNVASGAIGNSGEININAGSLSLTNGAQIKTTVRRASGSFPAGQGEAGNININVRDALTLQGFNQVVTSEGKLLIFPTTIASSLDIGTIGKAGNIKLEAGSLSLRDGSVITTSTFGKGNAGNITIDVLGAVTFDGINNVSESGLQSAVDAGAIGNGGDINITADSLSLTNGARVLTVVNRAKGGLPVAQGNAGDININVRDAVTLKGFSQAAHSQGQIPVNIIASILDLGAKGKAGNIRIEAGSASLNDGSQLLSSTLGQGNAGNITINVSEGLTIASSKESPERSLILSTVDFGGTGKGGDINITAGSFSLTNGSQIQTLVRRSLKQLPAGRGNAGNININVRDTVTIDGIDGRFPSGVSSSLDQGTKGSSGDINIRTRSLSLTNGARLESATFGRGNAGRIAITARDSVFLDGISGVSSVVGVGGKGRGGDISIDTGFLTATNGGQLVVSTFGKGDAGNVKIVARDSISFDGIGSDSEPTAVFSQVIRGAEGKGGNISIDSGSLTLTNGAQLSAGTFGNGDAGSIMITALDSVAFDGVGNNRTFSGVFSAVNSGAVGSGGNIVIETDLLFLNRAFIAADTLGQGNAGNISIQATEAVSLANSSSIGTGVLGGVGKGGDIQLKTGSLSLTDMSLITAATEGQGDAGNISIQATEAVSLKFSSITTDVLSLESSVGVRQGGDIALKAGSLSLTDLSSIAAATWGQGNAGNIFVQVDDSISIANSSISNSVQPGGVGNGGEMDIQARSLALTDGGQIESRVFGEFYSPVLNQNLPGGQGKGGNIRIDAADFVSISGVRLSDVIVDGINLGGKGESSGLFASTERGASGSAGSIAVTTPDFRLSEGAVVNTLTANDGNAGNITINANTFEATGGGQVITTTRSSGRAGNITLNITDSINLSGSDPTFANRLAKFGEDIVNNQGAESGLFANTATGSTGDGGSIFIDPNQVNLSDGAKISVNSQGQGDGGSIFLTADNLSLNNASEISAATASGEGGNITLNVADLLRQRNNSPISATAGGTGNGGNITIDTDFLVSSENSDITANAFEGRGGNIRITATGIFLAPGSEITASSELGVDGVVEINTPETEPSRGLVDLPENVVDPNKLIAQNACRRGRQSEFTITGRGGLPSTPEQIQNSDEVEVNLVEPAEESAATVTSPSISTAAKEIVPAQGWVRNEKGEVVLVGYNPANTGIQRQGRNTSSCQPR